MIKFWLIRLACVWVPCGVTYVTMVAWLRPKLLVRNDDEFRYDLASMLIFLWLFSLLYQCFRVTLTWPARWVVSRSSK